MTDRAMLYSAPMARALWGDRKTQTRRILKDQPINPYIENGDWWDETARNVATPMVLKAYVGDRIWVRESWRVNGWATDVATIVYRASERDSYTEMTEQFPIAGRRYIAPTYDRWRSSLHMPRWVSRMTLIVTDVRVERLQDISEADAVAEGVEVASTDPDWAGYRDYGNDKVMNPTAKGSYRTLWDSINGAGAWAVNPWVAAYTFRVIKQNIDQVHKVAA